MNVIKQKITIPYLEKEYTIRPYLVGEEKGLLIALETKDTDLIDRAVKNLIAGCVDEEINIDELSYFETEYLFIQLRKISVNNVVEIGVRHKHSENCQHIQRVKINLENLQTEGKVDNKIILSEEQNIGVVMKIPTNKTLSKSYSNQTSKIFGLIEDSIECIFDSENVYPTKDFSKEEISEWVGNLNNKQLQMIAEFFNDLPTFYYDVEYTCEKCGETEQLKVKGLSNFL